MQYKGIFIDGNNKGDIKTHRSKILEIDNISYCFFPISSIIQEQTGSYVLGVWTLNYRNIYKRIFSMLNKYLNNNF